MERARKKAKCKVVAVAARKGGVGKTFTAIQLAVNAAFGGPDKKHTPLKVMFVDVDSQQNSTYFFLKHFGAQHVYEKVLLPANPNCDDGQVYNITDIFMGNDFIEYPTQYPNLHIIPSDGQIDNFKGTEFSGANEELITIAAAGQFRKLIETVEEDYDLIVIDTPPSKTHASQGAIAACTDVIIVANLDSWNSENALPGIISDIELNNNQYRPQGEPVNIAGILLNKLSSKTLTKDERKHLKAIKAKYNKHLHKGFYFYDRVAFKTTEMPQDPSNFAWMKDPDTAHQMREAYEHIAKNVLNDIYAEVDKKERN